MARQPDLDVHARGREPLENEATWLVFCKACGWHTEVPAYYCWKGCPNCGADLWVTPPEPKVFRLLSGEAKREMPASEWSSFFRPRRRPERLEISTADSPPRVI